MSASTKVRVCDREYRTNHGAPPRGRGGNWGFYFQMPDGSEELFWAGADLTFSEARAEAVKVARSRGVSDIKVAS